MPEVPDNVDEAMDALSSPSTDEVFFATLGFSARQMAAESLKRSEEGGAAAAVVSCVLARDSSFDVRNVGDHPILWDALYDNYWSFNTLGAIPDGLGLDFSFDGSDAELTTTAAGTWAVTATGLIVEQDNTWEGYLDVGFGSVDLTAFTSDANGLASVTISLPSGATFAPKVETTAQATSGTYNASGAYLIVARLG